MFQPVLDDARRAESGDGVTRLVLCSGKIAVELESSPLRDEAEDVAVARIELLAPFPGEALTRVLGRYPHLEEIVWVQEEPRNMGAWTYVEPRLRDLLNALERPLPIRYAGRPERASPAEGAPDRHAAEHARIVRAALADAPAPVTAGNGRRRGGKPNGAARNGTRQKAARTSSGQQ
jgi:2-oxoglutarate dehydrogenase E1 component